MRVVLRRRYVRLFVIDRRACLLCVALWFSLADAPCSRVCAFIGVGVCFFGGFVCVLWMSCVV